MNQISSIVLLLLVLIAGSAVLGVDGGRVGHFVDRVMDSVPTRSASGAVPAIPPAMPSAQLPAPVQAWRPPAASPRGEPTATRGLASPPETRGQSGAAPPPRGAVSDETFVPPAATVIESGAAVVQGGIPVVDPSASHLGAASPAGAPSGSSATEVAELLRSWGPPPAPLVDPRRFTEAHWQGLELVPKTPPLARALGLPEVAGLVIDDVTLPADLLGFQAGDLVTHVEQTSTPDLFAFIELTEQLRDRAQVQISVIRDGEPLTLTLRALRTRLGNANGDTPSMIPPGARMPHAYRGPCTECHRVGTTGSLAIDQGDPIVRTAPPISPRAQRPHRDRGPCSICHRLLP
ncbi:MAG: magnetochrome domain-containing protein [Myxococcales bacterium]|nr:magnetochrome domain-containing protein [Myxococcales bacterium]